MSKVVAVIPIKTNNQRLPGKNTKMLGEHPLFHYMFSTAAQASGIDEIWVDSSDKDILKSAETYGFKTLERPIVLNSPETSGHDLLDYEVDNIQLKDEDIFVQLFVTQPFIKPSTINSSINLLKNNPTASSVLSLFEVENRFWHNDEPISHDPKLLQGTQYQNPIYCEAGFYTFRVGAFRNERARITKDFIKHIVSPHECVDIDTKNDFKFAETILNGN